MISLPYSKHVIGEESSQFCFYDDFNFGNEQNTMNMVFMLQPLICSSRIVFAGVKSSHALQQAKKV